MLLAFTNCAQSVNTAIGMSSSVSPYSKQKKNITNTFEEYRDRHPYMPEIILGIFLTKFF